MTLKTFISNSAKDTTKFGESLAKNLKAGDVICLFGNLGSGKTTFTKGLARGLKIKEAQVHSPTFTLMNVYESKRGLNLFHFDLYRIEKIEEIISLDYEEYFEGDGVTVVEWAERFGILAPKYRLEVHFKHAGEDVREIKLKPKGEVLKKRIGFVK
ncbi:MAG: tRNA (adenosine(37)-N6)-threonylcarbamoyltransferase complex ATPase subunit type 1 TsaE [Candidatus Zapsychrus exili]|nr:tRNA (adenosine(37)-N6)-threonylcarbamoyltransferase complex ATPase subunit type 1 TsaE [Candidatus Zapsychrus exili]